MDPSWVMVHCHLWSNDFAAWWSLMPSFFRVRMYLGPDQTWDHGTMPTGSASRPRRKPPRCPKILSAFRAKWWSTILDLRFNIINIVPYCAKPTWNLSIQDPWSMFHKLEYSKLVHPPHWPFLLVVFLPASVMASCSSSSVRISSGTAGSWWHSKQW